MTDIWAFLLRVYVPLVAALALLALIPLVRKKSEIDTSKATICISLLDLFRFEVPLPRRLRGIWPARVGLLTIALALVLTAALADYSRFFPSVVKMDVYFDEPGIRRVLSQFAPSEVQGVGIDTNRLAQVGDEYEAALKANLGRYWASAIASGRAGAYDTDTAGLTRSDIGGSGETTFRVQRVSALSYQIVESQGFISNTADIPGRPPLTFRTEFVLRRSPHNYLRPTVREFFRGVVVRPEFKQFVYTGPRTGESVPIDHVVVGMTRIQLFPVPTFTGTIYLWKRPRAPLVPVGYAVYHR